MPCILTNHDEHVVYVALLLSAGRLVLFAALHGVRALGIELVPSRHDLATRALAALSSESARSRVELRCGDALAMREPYSRVTHILCNNAIWADSLNAQVFAHIAAETPRLEALVMLKEPPAMAVAASDLELVRASALSVTWDRIGWPAYVYRRRHIGGLDGVATAPRVQCDDSFFAASEAGVFNMI